MIRVTIGRYRVVLCLLLLGLVVTIGQVRALAQPAPAVDKVKVAKQYVDAGLAAQSTGDYDTALTMYSKAYQLVAHPLLLFNMAQAHRLAGHIEQALTLYAKYLAEDPNGAQAQTARELVTELRARKAEAARRPKATDAESEDEPAGDAITSVANKSRNEPIDDSSTGGTLVVRAKNQSGVVINDGTVMIDEDPKGKLASGKLTVTDIAEGRHTIAIEAGGYRRFEETVTVHDGEQARLDALLLDKAAPSSSSQGTFWKVSLGASVVVMVAGVAYAFHSNDRMLKHSGSFDPAIDSTTNLPYTRDIVAPDAGDCGSSPDDIAQAKHSKVASQSNFDRACTWKARVYISFYTGCVGALGAVVSLIMLTRDTGPPEAPATGTRSKKPEVTLLPIVMPDGGGASFSLTW